jgi:histidinol-phosphate aminotransferase
MRANGVLLRDRSTDPGCDGFVRITIGLEEHVSRGLAALKVSLNEIGWKKQQVGEPASQQDGDGVREFE